mgnify:CR=1 FL=1
MSEKVAITYESFSPLELVSVWLDDDFEKNSFIKETNIVAPENFSQLDDFEIDNFINENLKQIRGYAQKCDMRFCDQCCNFVETPYIDGDDHYGYYCVKCRVEIGMLGRQDF